MADKLGYKVRLRVRLAKVLNTENSSRTVVVAGREVVVSAQEKNQPLKDSRWIVLTVRGFMTEEEAHSFGDRLRGIVELAGLCARIGMDVGRDKPTTQMNEEWARSIGLIQQDERTVPNIHGLAILPDDDKTRVPLVSFEATVRADPNQFLGALAEVGQNDLPDNFSTVEGGVRALNFAIASQEALARMAIAISAVEALGQSETWTSVQKTLLDELATRAEIATNVSETERQEVADALRRVQRFGLRQGVMRILKSLGLLHLRKEWDDIYGFRSSIFHGTMKVRDDEIAQLALDTETLCGRIILAFARSKGVQLASIAATHFPPT